MIPCERDRIALSWSLRAGIVFFGLLCSAAPGKAQARGAFRADRMDTVLYGVAYYPEYMPYDRLDQDVQLMQKAGITVVRIGEFSWGLWEPEDGKFEFAWMDRVVEKLRAAGIRIIMGTPTYSIPAWMYKEHPEESKDRKSTRLNSSHSQISYAVFCLKKKKKKNTY